jgi:hypothetical protein
MLTAVRLLAIILTLALAGGAMEQASAGIAMADCATMADDGMADCAGAPSDASGVTLSCDLACTPPAVATLPASATDGGPLRVARVRDHHPGRLPRGRTPALDPSPPRSAILI